MSQDKTATVTLMTVDFGRAHYTTMDPSSLSFMARGLYVFPRYYPNMARTNYSTVGLSSLHAV